MATCFVIQPFDSGKFDKRFTDVYEPAIKAAGLDAYRVDRDPGVDVPIDAIEGGIRSAAICLADITTDNPNVWYELGFAYAAGRPVVMVCSQERTAKKYPFDIQHRTIITYVADSSSDFEALEKALTARIKALLTKNETLRQIAETEQISPIHGLSQPELFVLAELASSLYMPDSHVGAYQVKNDVEKAGLTALGFSLGVRRLVSKEFIEAVVTVDYNEESYTALRLLEKGWQWIEANENLFKVHKPKPLLDVRILTDDDVPF